VLRQGLAMLATSVGLALGVAACGNGAGRPLVIPKNGLGVQATTTTTTPDQAVIAGWIAAITAFLQASSPRPNPDYAGLQNTMVNPALRDTQLVLAEEKAAGDTLRGTQYLGHPIVVSYSPKRATVRSCLPGPGALLYGSNGTPVPGSLGEPGNVEITSVMVPGTDGTWMLQSGNNKFVASCPA
jgi:hypothetical protein